MTSLPRQDATLSFCSTLQVFRDPRLILNEPEAVCINGEERLFLSSSPDGKLGPVLHVLVPPEPRSDDEGVQSVEQAVELLLDGFSSVGRGRGVQEAVDDQVGRVGLDDVAGGRLADDMRKVRSLSLGGSATQDEGGQEDAHETHRGIAAVVGCAGIAGRASVM